MVYHIFVLLSGFLAILAGIIPKIVEVLRKERQGDYIPF